MSSTLYDLLYDCTVKLTLSNGSCGTGFFVAPGYVLTCEHVVRDAGDTPIRLRWRLQDNFAQGYVETACAEADIALIKFEPPYADLPCVYFDNRDIALGEKIYCYGYTNNPEYPHGYSVSPECEGFIHESPPLIQMKAGQFQPGMSGSALLNLNTGKVCGMAKFTRDKRNALGGGGVKTSIILERFPQLKEWQQQFHQRDIRWQQFLDQIEALSAPQKNSPNNLPRSGSIQFVGRDAELAALHNQLQQTEQPAITAIQGMGGIGKTELALRYAQQHRDHNTYAGGICWLSAKEQDIGSQLVTFAINQLELSIPIELDIQGQINYCWRHWPLEGDVLVVIDDVSGHDDIAAYRAIEPYLPPQEPRFWVLLTTRLQLGASVHPFQIEVLSEVAALHLLESLVGPERIVHESKTARALCDWLGYLPLGLELVGRFLARKPTWTLAKMQKQLEQKHLEAKALNKAQPDMTATHESVAAAFELSWKTLDPPVQELAYHLCLYALAPIPWTWIEAEYDNVDSDNLEEWRDEGLIYRSLLKLFDTQQEKVQLHQMIREFFRKKLELWPEADALKQRYTQHMVWIARGIPQTPTRDLIVQVTLAIPHLAEAATTWQRWLEEDSLLWPFVGLGRFYEGQGAYDQACAWWQACLDVTRQRLGHDHPDVASSLNNLALFYHSQGRYAEAEPLHLEALQQRRALFGNQHREVANSLNNLALLYRVQGRYAEAESLYLESLELSRKLLGDNHPDVAQTLNNLAVLYKFQSRYAEAEPLYLEALQQRRALFGNNHPDLAQTLNNLAELYRAQGRYAEAEPLYLEALQQRQQLLGDNHPDVANSLNNLALLYQSQGRYKEAESLHTCALQRRRESLGDNHPDVANSLNNLAVLYHSQSRYAEAEPLYLKILQRYRSLFGNNHPDVATSLNNLAGLYECQGRYAEAEPLHLEALQQRRALFGNNHPDVANSLNNLAGLYESQGRYAEAESLYLEALQRRRALFGDNHPDVINSLNNLAGLYHDQGRYSDAELLYQEVLSRGTTRQGGQADCAV